jgi:homogentisate 1,2-dioxygenase
MLDRMACGTVPPKHHLALRDAAGALRYEECLTRDGFDGPYTILYHEHRPQAVRAVHTAHVCRSPDVLEGRLSDPLRRRHLATPKLEIGGAPLDARVPLLCNADVVIAAARPSTSDPVYLSNADADTLWFIRQGAGVLRSVFGDLPFNAGDYLLVPKGGIHRFVLPESTEQDWLSIECRSGLGLPQQFRNETGQLRMDAPYCHRDFRRPTFVGPVDEGIREIVVKRGEQYHGFACDHPPLDVVGWDGTVYPWVFPIRAFQPRVGAVHLPPTVHGTFHARGVLVCSFVPRPLDFHPQAVPCPYPHASVDVDEVLYYVEGAFTSRSGVAAGSITHHPRGIPHGPQPGRYEASIGTQRTDELAVMLDCALPLAPTRHAAPIEEVGYEATFAG